MLDQNVFVVKEHAKLLSSRNTYDILDPETAKPIAVAEQKTTAMAMLLGQILKPPATTIEVRTKPGDELIFSVRRRGLLLKKVEAVDAKGEVLGVYKTKKLSLAGGFHVYGADGKHLAEIRGKLLKADYTFYTPDGKTILGSVSKKWDGVGRALFSSADTYRVEVKPEAADDPTMKTLILGAALAADALFDVGGDEG